MSIARDHVLAANPSGSYHQQETSEINDKEAVELLNDYNNEMVSFTHKHTL